MVSENSKVYQTGINLDRRLLAGLLFAILHVTFAYLSCGLAEIYRILLALQ